MKVNKILNPVDGSDHSIHATRYAIELAGVGVVAERHGIIAGTAGEVDGIVADRIRERHHRPVGRMGVVHIGKRARVADRHIARRTLRQVERLDVDDGVVDRQTVRIGGHVQRVIAEEAIHIAIAGRIQFNRRGVDAGRFEQAGPQFFHRVCRRRL